MSDAAVANVQSRLSSLQDTAANMAAQQFILAREFLARHANCGAFHTDESAEIGAERVSRTLAGASLRVRKLMPAHVRRSGEGVITINWNSDHGERCGIIQWQQSPSTDASLRQIILGSALDFGEFDPHQAQALTDRILTELYEARLSLSEFSLQSRDPQCSYWIWKRAVLVV